MGYEGAATFHGAPGIPSDLKPVSDRKAQGITQQTSEQITWLPTERTTWVYAPSKPGGAFSWRQYTEGGQNTGQELDKSGISNGAIAPGAARLLAFYGNMIAKGAVVSYSDHHTAELSLDCVPRAYGISNDPDYAGAFCTTERDVLPEDRGDKVPSSEFLLLRTTGPSVVWRQRMSWVSVANSNETDAGWQKGDPLIYRFGHKLWIVAPSKSPALTVYEIDAPE